MINNRKIKKRTLLRDVLMCLFLVIATVAVYWQVRNHDFVNFDDDRYVTENSHVQAGLSRENIVWAFTTTDSSNWHPLTWLSHMLDCQLYGVSPKGHHLTNVLFHLVSTVLLFLILRWTTGALWRSGFVAALFALHPLHVESVAWVAERKDVLSTFFWMLTIWSYIRYVQRPAVNRYLLVLLLFAMGLMAKAMLVTLPFVLLLFDYWPLERMGPGQSGMSHAVQGHPSTFTEKPRPQAFSLLLEKTPMFVLAALSCLVTFLAQRSGGAVGAWEIYPLNIRIANGLVSYVTYIIKMIWPQNLAVFYPHPGQSLPLWQAAGAGLVLLIISITVIRLVRRYPYLPVGWLWYVGTLVPVIGLVQVGAQAMADRYTYVPLIGLFIMVSWGIPELAAKWRFRRVGLGLAAGAVIVASMILTWTNLHHWKNSAALFEHALEVTDDNYLAHNNLGIVYMRQGNIDKAIEHYTKALQIKYNLPKTHNNLGNAYARQGKIDMAIAHYTAALQINPDFAGAHNNLGNALAGQGKIEEAILHLSRSQELQPDFAEPAFNLGNLLAQQGKIDDALAQFTRALELEPDFAEAHNSLGVILARKGRLDDAIVHFHEALRLKPTFLQAHNNLTIAIQQAGYEDESSRHGSKPPN
jgi:Flp pilus assembly protein TadD